MTIKYPNGKAFQSQSKKTDATTEKVEYGNRGMTLEEDINATNQYYLEHDIAVIHKKPTPVQIVKVDYPARSAAVIKEAYFKLASTTDYNGVYNGRYIDFEAKETRQKSFPLKNIHAHQIEHMKQVEKHGGIAFLLIYFSELHTIFFIEAKHFIPFWDRMQGGGRKSVSYKEIAEKGTLLSLGFTPRIDYLKEVDRLIREV